MDETERAKRMEEAIRKTAVLELPGMDRIEVRREVPYGPQGTFDLYVSATGTPAPTVFFVYGFPNPAFAQGLRNTGGYTSWGRLLAASGMNAIAYSYRDPATDFAALVAYVRDHPHDLGVDTSRLGLWAASGNVPVAVHALMTPQSDTFKAAALLYGYVLDVPQAAEDFGLAVPARGRTIEALPKIPLMVVRAGNDETPGINASIDSFVREAIAHDLPITLVNQTGAPHAFDLFDDRDTSRTTIRQVLHFLRDQLFHKTPLE